MSHRDEPLYKLDYRIISSLVLVLVFAANIFLLRDSIQDFRLMQWFLVLFPAAGMVSPILTTRYLSGRLFYLILAFHVLIFFFIGLAFDAVAPLFIPWGVELVLFAKAGK